MTNSEPEAQSNPAPKGALPRAIGSLARLTTGRLAVWPLLTLVAVLAVFAICVSLWRFENLRPLLSTLGAGAAAFLGPLPGLLTPEMRGKWLFAVGAATLITAGTWFAVKNIDDDLSAARDRIRQLDARLDAQARSLGTLIGAADDDTQDKLFLASGPFYRSLFREERWQPILDTSLAMLAVRHDNGHALYFAGEAYRHLGKREPMRGVFLNYQAAARERPAAQVGAAAACYQSPEGYCQERLGWVLHLMADDYLTEAAGMKLEARRDGLAMALQYERWNLALRPTGFFARDSARSSCDILRTLRRDLVGHVAADLDELSQHLEEPCILE